MVNEREDPKLDPPDERLIECAVCGGEGLIEGRECRRCDGAGEIPESQPDLDEEREEDDEDD